MCICLKLYYQYAANVISMSLSVNFPNSYFTWLLFCVGFLAFYLTLQCFYYLKIKYLSPSTCFLFQAIHLFLSEYNTFVTWLYGFICVCFCISFYDFLSLPKFQFLSFFFNRMFLISITVYISKICNICLWVFHLYEHNIYVFQCVFHSINVCIPYFTSRRGE